ncbi:MAG: Druantia anti-phage system protein DruA [Acidiferrobacteraceae bacterium]
MRRASYLHLPRDQFIGWISEQRQRNLHLIVNNTRLLILPSPKDLCNRKVLSQQVIFDNIPADVQRSR